MNTRNFSMSNEIEPRILPRQSSAVTNATVPAVPEVSQMFDHTPSKSSPIPNTYAHWKQQVPQRLNKPDAGIRSSPKPPIYQSRVDPPRRLIPHPPGQHSPDLTVKKPPSLSPNSYARDSRLKFYQKVSPIAETRVAPPRNYQREDVRQSEIHVGAISGGELPRRGISSLGEEKKGVLTTENYRNGISASKNHKNSIPSSENSRNGIKTLDNHKNPFPATGDYKNAIPTSTQFYKQSTPPIQSKTHNQLQRSNSLDLSRYPGQNSNSTSDLVLKDHFQQNYEPATAVERVETTCNCHSHKSTSDEIITQLLSLVQSQNTQIQMLQGQVESLLQLRTRELPDYQRIPIASQEYQANAIDQQRYKKTGQIIESDEKIREDKLQQLIKEKKVSIGVMTSFELTVQDSVVYNVENGHKPADVPEKANLNRNTTVRTPNKLPQGLEQITEASESHLSSTLQASNNFNTYSSARRSSPHGNLAADSMAPEKSTQEYQEKQKIPDNHLELQNGMKNDFKSTSPVLNHTKEANHQKMGLRNEKRPEIDEKSLIIQEKPEKRVIIPNSPGELVDDQKRTPKLGWTLYDNVMCQVNEILQNSQGDDNTEVQKVNQQTSQFQLENHSKLLVNGVQQSAVEQLKFFGFTFADTTACSETRPAPIDVRVPIDASYYPRLDYQANVIQTSGTASDTSMHMKALAMKYLGTNQLPNVSTNKRGMELLTSMMISNMQNNVSINDAHKIDANPRKSPRADNYIINGKQNPQNILDISSLKRQPKLL